MKIVLFDLFETLLCAAWFLRQHTDLLGEDIVMRRAAGYPVLYHPSELTARMRDLCAAC